MCPLSYSYPITRVDSSHASRRFVTWNILGILDLVIAVSLGALSSGFVPGVAGLIGGVTTAPMSQLPLVLIPVYLVPIFIMLHFTALSQSRRLRRLHTTNALRDPPQKH